jgi:hypothetical protein
MWTVCGSGLSWEGVTLVAVSWRGCGVQHFHHTLVELANGSLVEVLGVPLGDGRGMVRWEVRDANSTDISKQQGRRRNTPASIGHRYGHGIPGNARRTTRVIVRLCAHHSLARAACARVVGGTGRYKRVVRTSVLAAPSAVHDRRLRGGRDLTNSVSQVGRGLGENDAPQAANLCTKMRGLVLVR